MKRVRSNATVEGLIAAFDDRHTERVTFIRDDLGDWWAQTGTDHGHFSSYVWWRLEPPLDEDTAVMTRLEEILDAAREVGKAPI